MPTQEYRYLHSKLRDLHDPQILALLGELKDITGIAPEHDPGSWLFHHLSQCIYPNGPGKVVPITKDDLDENDPLDLFVLRKKVKNLAGTSIHDLCDEICRHFGEGLERHEGQSLHVFINRFFTLKKKKPSAPRRFFK